MKSAKVPEKMAYRLEEVSRIAKIDPEVIDAWEEELYFFPKVLAISCSCSRT